MIPLSFSSLTRSPPSGAASSSSSSSSSTSSSSSSSSNPTSSSSSTATSFLSYRSSSSSSLPSFLPTVLSRDSEAPSASSQPRRGISASSSSSLHLGSKTKGLWGRENTGPARTGRESPSEGQNEAEKDEEEKKDGGGERKLDAGARPRKTAGEGGKENKLTVRAERFHAVLAKPDVDLQELRHLLWSGVPACCPRWIRSDSWRLVLGYLPLNRDRIHHVLKKRRSEYTELLQHYYHKETLSLDESKLLRQLRVDLPRTHSGLHFFSHARIQRCMERALFLWAVKNPASGYVQGINDLITPFISVFLESSLGQDPETASIDEIPSDILNEVEADSFWCLSKLLAHIQDHFTFGQPGIQKSVLKLTDIVKRVDEPLYVHLTSQGVDFLQMSFRWMNCLLMREFPLRCVIRLWDTYIAEQAEGFSTFHVYVCAVFLVYWSSQLKKMNFQQMMIFIQNFPTSSWTEQEIETLLAEAFVLKSLFHSAPKHLAS